MLNPDKKTVTVQVERTKTEYTDVSIEFDLNTPDEEAKERVINITRNAIENNTLQFNESDEGTEDRAQVKIDTDEQHGEFDDWQLI